MTMTKALLPKDLIIDGVRIGRFVRSVTTRTEVGCLPSVTIEINQIESAGIDSEGIITVKTLSGDFGK